MMQTRTRHLALIASAAATTLLLMACGQPDGAATGEKRDAAPLANSQPKAQQAPDSPEQAAQKRQDAHITASIQAELAKDPTLSALAIKVDTKEGLVSLNGKAPDPATREHATRVAATIKGVLSVDNHMLVNS